jgi:surface protein
LTHITDANKYTAVAQWYSDEWAATSTWGHVSTWDLTQLTVGNGMFNALDFNADISGWDTSAVTSMGLAGDGYSPGNGMPSSSSPAPPYACTA